MKRSTKILMSAGAAVLLSGLCRVRDRVATPTANVRAQVREAVGRTPVTSVSQERSERAITPEAGIRSVPEEECSASDYLLMDPKELHARIPHIRGERELQTAVYALARSLAPTDSDHDLFLWLLRTAKDERLLATLLWAIGMRAERTPLADVYKFLAHENAEVRLAAVRAVGRIPDPAGTELLFETARSDPDYRVRGESLVFLPSLPPGAEERCTEALRREPHEEVRRGWVGVLEWIDSPQAHESLAKVVGSAQEAVSVRKRAMTALTASKERIADWSRDSSLPQELRSHALELMKS